MRQQIRFVTTADGTRIAWARHGQGPALVRVATWLTHLEYDWESPVWRRWLSELDTRFTVPGIALARSSMHNAARRCTMPLINVKLIEGVFTGEEKQRDRSTG